MTTEALTWNQRPERRPAAGRRSTGWVEVLTDRLVEEMALAWRQGQRWRATDYLAEHAELQECSQAVARLLEQEAQLRREFGATPEPAREAAIPQATLPSYPEIGERLDGLRLVAELGCGAHGRVVLATESALGDRPVVLKLTSAAAEEHLALARLQHTHIVPLYWARDCPQRRLRILCLPYLGGATLADLFHHLADVPPGRRTGQQLLDALDRLPEAGLARGSGQWATGNSPTPARKFLARANFLEVVCWIGACLADALAYAHDHGLVHLDLKPGNVLLAGDGQPMLLDFHLARGPLRPGDPAPSWLGGTPGYMSPEQHLALEAVRHRGVMPAAVDGRSDVYALGLLLYEALSGTPPNGSALPYLRHVNPQVSIGLADMVHKCLAKEAGQRYPDAASLGADLRRHLSGLPLRGVANRSWAERWHNWRRRRPLALARAVLLVVIGAMLLGWGAFTLSHFRQRYADAEAALAEGRRLLEHHAPAEAATAFERGRDVARATPGAGDLARLLDAEGHRARGEQAVQRLHVLANQARFLYDPASLPAAELARLDTCCHGLWGTRHQLRIHLAMLGPDARREVEADLLDLAVFWADLRVRRAASGEADQARREVLSLLAEAETLFGPSPVVAWERRDLAAALGDTNPIREAGYARDDRPPQTAWESYALARRLLRDGRPAPAREALRRALEQQPEGFWPNFYDGVCAYQLERYDEAAAAFRVCVALAPRSAECSYNLALALAALGRGEAALEQYGRALRLDPGLAAAALNRATLWYERRRYSEAVADLRQALAHGADPAAVYYNLAMVQQAQGDRVAARASVDQALSHQPGHRGALALRETLGRERESYPGNKVNRERGHALAGASGSGA